MINRFSRLAAGKLFRLLVMTYLVTASGMSSAGMIATINKTITTGTFNGNSINGAEFTMAITIADGAVDANGTAAVARYEFSDAAVSAVISVSGANGGSFNLDMSGVYGFGNIELTNQSTSGNDVARINVPLAHNFIFSPDVVLDIFDGVGGMSGSVDDVLALVNAPGYMTNGTYGYSYSPQVYSDNAGNTLEITDFGTSGQPGYASLSFNSDSAAVPTGGTLGLALLGLGALQRRLRRLNA